MLRVPIAQKWSSDVVAAVDVTPWSLHAPKQPDVVFKDHAGTCEVPVEAPVRVARRVYIKAADVEIWLYFGLS